MIQLMMDAAQIDWRFYRFTQSAVMFSLYWIYPFRDVFPSFQNFSIIPKSFNRISDSKTYFFHVTGSHCEYARPWKHDGNCSYQLKNCIRIDSSDVYRSQPFCSTPTFTQCWYPEPMGGGINRPQLTSIDWAEIEPIGGLVQRFWIRVP